MFLVDEKVVYPGHGVAQITRTIERHIAGNTTTFYELKFLNKDMTILVPEDNMARVGIRRLSSAESINVLFDLLCEPMGAKATECAATSNWNKRNKKILGDLRKGDLARLGHIYKDLKHMATVKELSFGEKNLLQQTEALLAQEISLVKNISEDKAIEHLRSMFTALPGRTPTLSQTVP